MAQLTPMMQQYMEIKNEHKDCILLYRLGDFYEMFFEDALTASRELEITLTGRDCGQEERAPMCGVPFHSIEPYINKLVQKGYKVAICEQVEDPKQAKGIVKREVIRIVTPGTILNASALDETKNNYLMCIIYSGDMFGISVVDVSTGDYYVTEVNSAKKAYDEISRFSPSEIIGNDALIMSSLDLNDLRERLNINVTTLEPWYYDDEKCVMALKEHFKVQSLDGLGLKDFPLGITTAGALLQYLIETQKNSLSHLTRITPYTSERFMLLDSSSRRNLELVETLREKQKRGSLLWVLDKTKTAMGARLLRKWIEEPLVEEDSINRRLDCIEAFNSSLITREEIKEYLQPIYDLERLIGRVVYKTANPRDLIAFKNSLEMLPHIKHLLKEFQCEHLVDLHNNLDELSDIYQLIDKAIIDEPPFSVREGGIIKTEFNDDVKKFRIATTEGKEWIADLEVKEREETGIKNLKIKHNNVFGYYIEVTKSNVDMVPDHYTRKQTLSNAERYITPQLKELEDLVLGSEEKIVALEYELFCKVRDTVADEVTRIQQTAKVIATIDVLQSLSYVAEKNNYVRPNINKKGIIRIKDGRHPVVEKMIPNDMFVTNDTFLDNGDNKISIITGPNMAGKSTYMRQAALIVLMAQIGSFVPASEANIGICDRIFTRVGASDDLASGQSTFMVEMTEVANILRNATKNSLLILDEIGRGTSTFDGLSIAWAVIEHICNGKNLGCKTLFATHYHELTELEGKLPGVTNYCIAVKEQGDDIIFLRKIVKGGADKSYGIQVAKLAGVPDVVISRAKEIVQELSDNDIVVKAKEIEARTYVKTKELPLQMSLFDEENKSNVLVEKLKNIDMNDLSPKAAWELLEGLQKEAKKSW